MDGDALDAVEATGAVVAVSVTPRCPSVLTWVLPEAGEVANRCFFGVAARALRQHNHANKQSP